MCIAPPPCNAIADIMCAGEFRNYFEKYGRVLSAEVMFNRETHKSRGFGFIVFESEAGVDAVCAEREHIIDGKLVSNATRPLSTVSCHFMTHHVLFAHRWK